MSRLRIFFAGKQKKIIIIIKIAYVKEEAEIKKEKKKKTLSLRQRTINQSNNQHF